MTLRTLNYGNYGIFLIMGNAGFCPSAVRAGEADGHGNGDDHDDGEDDGYGMMLVKTRVLLVVKISMPMGKERAILKIEKPNCIE